jgi:putative tryptophan/tyrosine transport system substrate-binding protein
MAHRQSSCSASRREFITLLGGAAAAWPLAVGAQQRTMPVIGFLHDQSPEGNGGLVGAFQRGLAEIGFFEGQNLIIEYRWIRGEFAQASALATNLANRGVSVIASPGNTTLALAARAVTQTIPIVFAVGVDPVEIGLVSSLARPGGNLTGVSILNTTIMAKRLELLHELAPRASVIGLLFNPTNPVAVKAQTEEAEQAARVLGVRIVVLHASSQNEVDEVFARLAQQGIGALVVSGNPLFLARGEQLAALASRFAMPTIYQYRETTRQGGLMNYGTNLADAYRLVGSYTGRILKGEKPADLPVQQSVNVELAINLKTAKALGITFPTALLVRADEVIE